MVIDDMALGILPTGYDRTFTGGIQQTVRIIHLVIRNKNIVEANKPLKKLSQPNFETLPKRLTSAAGLKSPFSSLRIHSESSGNSCNQGYLTIFKP